jgi:hypothetical protein
MMIESAVTELTAVVGTSGACAAVGRPRASHYRRLNPPAPNPKREPAPQPRALTVLERAQVLEVLHSKRFVDMAPPSVYATLLDEGNYLASIPTMYRILRSVDEVRERRRVAMHPSYVKPELVAGRPNSVWSWDITKLLGPAKWTYRHRVKRPSSFRAQPLGGEVPAGRNGSVVEIDPGLQASIESCGAPKGCPSCTRAITPNNPIKPIRKTLVG